MILIYLLINIGLMFYNNTNTPTINKHINSLLYFNKKPYTFISYNQIIDLYNKNIFKLNMHHKHQSRFLFTYKMIMLLPLKTFLIKFCVFILLSFIITNQIYYYYH